jgi:hypothetical protein
MNKGIDLRLENFCKFDALKKHITMRLFLVTILIFWTAPNFAQSTLFENGNSSLTKGNVFISTTFSIQHNQGENQSRLIQNLDKTYTLDWDVTLRSGYFIKENFAVGGFLKYSNFLNKLSYTNDNGSVTDESLEREYSIAPFIRNYFPLGNGRFCLFNETNIQFTYGSSVRQIDEIDDLSRTVGQSYKIKIGIQPGVAAFITKGISFEVGTSLLGLSSSYSTTITNGDEDGKGYNYSNDVSFKIDLLSLFLGVTFYFPVK